MSKNITLAFDVYGTLIDTNGVVHLLETMVGNRAKVFLKHGEINNLSTLLEGLL